MSSINVTLLQLRETVGQHVFFVAALESMMQRSRYPRYSK